MGNYLVFPFGGFWNVVLGLGRIFSLIRGLLAERPTLVMLIFLPSLVLSNSATVGNFLCVLDGIYNVWKQRKNVADEESMLG